MDDHLTEFVARVVASRRAHPPIPDPGCMAAAVKNFDTMIRCLTAAGLSDEDIAATVCQWLSEAGCPLPGNLEAVAK